MLPISPGRAIRWRIAAAPSHDDVHDTPVLFGDLLALARQSWVRQMTERLEQLGYADYRRSDAVVARRLLRGPTAVGQLGVALGVTRQAARKIVSGLEQRQFVVTGRDPRDSRRVTVALTPAGEAYARSVVDVIGALNREYERRLDDDTLAAARRALAEVLEGSRARRAPGPDR